MVEGVRRAWLRGAGLVRRGPGSLFHCAICDETASRSARDDNLRLSITEERCLWAGCGLRATSAVVVRL